MEINCQFHVPAALPLEKESPVPIEWMAGWVVETVWTHFWVEKNFLFVSEVEPLFLCCAVRSLFAIPTTLSQLTQFSAAECYFSSVQALESIQANDYRWKRSGYEGGHFHVVSRSRLRSYSSRQAANKVFRCDSVAKPKRVSPCKAHGCNAASVAIPTVSAVC
jgi:hypothetical protein